ncbi:MAG: FGGY family carbohydrate kinase [Acidimicrobiia bacterium]
MPFVLGVDSAARSTAVELRDAESGELFGSGRSVHPPTDQAEHAQDPHVWWNALVDARRDAGGALGMNAVAVAAQMHGLVALDREGQVIGPASVGADPDVARDAASLVETFGGVEPWVNACGSVPDTSFAIAKLAWLRRTQPEEFARVAKVMLAHDWLTLRLSRKLVTDRGGASSTGYFSPRDGEWRSDLLALVDPDKSWEPCLPRVAVAGEPAGDREGVVIAGGTGSAMAAALGLALQPRDVVVSLDHACVFTVRERPTEDPTGQVSGLADATGRFLPLVASLASLGVLESFANVLGVDHSRFDRLALEAPPGSGGVRFLPAEAARLDQPAREGILTGLDVDSSPSLVARAAVEGVGHRLLDDIEALRQADVPVGGRLLLLGSARSHSLSQVLADLSGRPVAVPKGDRVIAGACVLAAAALHSAPPEELSTAWGLDRARELEPNRHVDSDELRSSYKRALAARAAR